MSKGRKNPDVVISVPEIKLSYNSGNFVTSPKKIANAKEAVAVIRSLYNNEEIELHEIFFVLYLNRSGRPLGYYKHTIGGLTQTAVDATLILATALKCLASGFILAHNHPGGDTKPSTSDEDLTRKLKSAARLFDIELLDHIIISKDEHYSFADVGMTGIPSSYQNLKKNYPDSKSGDTLCGAERTALELEIELKKI